MSEFSGDTSARRLHLRRRFDKTQKTKPQSPSYGVHNGLIRNPNWPPPPGVEMPTDRRMSPRFEYSFELLYAGRAITVNGDVSATGAMFVLERLMPTSHVELSVRIPGESLPRRVAGEVIRTSYKGAHIAHHVRFNDPAQLGGAMSHIVSRGAVALR